MDYFESLGSALAYGVLGVVLLVIGYLVIDLLTPGHLGRTLVEDRSANAAVVAGSNLLALGAVVTSAIVASVDDDLVEGLAEAAGYGVGGIVLLAIAFRAVDVLTPGSLGDVIHEPRLAPLAVVLGAFTLAVGGILAASIV